MGRRAGARLRAAESCAATARDGATRCATGVVRDERDHIAFAGPLTAEVASVALDALAQVDGVTLLIAGDGDEQKPLGTGYRLRLAGRVRFLGPLVDRGRELFRAADASILGAGELPHTVVEALAWDTAIATASAASPGRAQRGERPARPHRRLGRVRGRRAPICRGQCAERSTPGGRRSIGVGVRPGASVREAGDDTARRGPSGPLTAWHYACPHEQATRSLRRSNALSLAALTESRPEVRDPGERARRRSRRRLKARRLPTGRSRSSRRCAVDSTALRSGSRSMADGARCATSAGCSDLPDGVRPQRRVAHLTARARAARVVVGCTATGEHRRASTALRLVVRFRSSAIGSRPLFAAPTVRSVAVHEPSRPRLVSATPTFRRS